MEISLVWHKEITNFHACMYLAGVVHCSELFSSWSLMCTGDFLGIFQRRDISESNRNQIQCIHCCRLLTAQHHGGEIAIITTTNPQCRNVSTCWPKTTDEVVRSWVTSSLSTTQQLSATHVSLQIGGLHQRTDQLTDIHHCRLIIDAQVRHSPQLPDAHTKLTASQLTISILLLSTSRWRPSLCPGRRRSSPARKSSFSRSAAVNPNATLLPSTQFDDKLLGVALRCVALGRRTPHQWARRGVAMSPTWRRRHTPAAQRQQQRCR